MKKLYIFILLILLLSLSSCNITIENKESEKASDVDQEISVKESDNRLINMTNNNIYSFNNTKVNRPVYNSIAYFYVDNVKYYKYSYASKEDLYDEYNELCNQANKVSDELDAIAENYGSDESIIAYEEKNKELDDLFDKINESISKIRQYVGQRKEISYNEFKKVLNEIPSEYKTYKDLSTQYKEKYGIKDNIESKQFNYNYYNGQLCVLNSFHVSDSTTDILSWDNIHYMLPTQSDQILYFENQEYGQMEGYIYNNEYNFKKENNNTYFVNFATAYMYNIVNKKTDYRIEQFVQSHITNISDYTNQEGVYMKEENGNIVKYSVAFDLIPYKPLRININKIDSRILEIRVTDAYDNEIKEFQTIINNDDVKYYDGKLYFTKKGNYKIFVHYEDENGPYLSSITIDV